jgi:CRP/FNR family transcriptional regulator, cyclic AMP receptor protein
MDVLAYFKEILSVEEYHQLVRIVQVKKGNYLYMPPQKPGEMFLIQQGLVKIGTYTEEGAEVCYDLLYRQEVFGNLRYLNGQFFEFAKALTDCTVACIELGFYKKMIVHDPLVSDWFNRSTIQRWCRMETRLFKICTLSPPKRLEALFREFDGEVEDAKGKKISIPTLLTSVDISQMTGLSRQTVAKLLKEKDVRITKKNKKSIDFISTHNTIQHVT